MSKYSFTFRNGLKLLGCILACSLLLSSPPAYGSDATGFVEYGCSVFPYRLALVRYRKQKLPNPIWFHLPRPEYLKEFTKDWAEGWDASQCGADRCEEIAKDKLQGVHASYRWRRWPRTFSGNFSIEYKDGRKLQGSFKAKFIKPKTQILCE